MHFKYLISISESDNTDFVGTKGKNLHQLIKVGINVPLTYCITSRAYELFIDSNNLRKKIHKILKDGHLIYREKSKRIIDLIHLSDIPYDIQDELRNHDYINNSDFKWAVRSSSNMEDLSKASFAGLYESYLNVQDLDNIFEKIKRCWDSLWSESAIIYRERNGISHTKASMAVIIQKMVDAEYAGVIFTKDLGSAHKDMIHLEYCKGLGERLVSGKVTPYSCRIERSSKTIHHDNIKAKERLEDLEIINLSSISLEIEERFGDPQDIEWAFDGKESYILQSRPITSQPKFKRISSSIAWTRANIGEILPNVVTPLTWDVFQAILLNRTDLVTGVKNYKFTKNILLDNVIKRIQGRVYIRLDKFLDSFCYLPFVDSDIISRVLGLRIHTIAQSYMKPRGVLVRLAQGAFLINLARIFPRLSTLVRRLSALPPAKPELLERLMAWNARCFHLHIISTAYTIGTYAIISHFLSRFVSLESKELLPTILIGHEDLQTATQGISLWEIAEYVRNNTTLQDILKDSFDWTEVRQKIFEVEGGLQFLRMFEAFMDRNGARAIGEFELAIPRWREDPSFVLSVLRGFLNNKETSGQLPSGYRIRRDSQKEAFSNIASNLNTFQQMILSRLLASYSDFATLRENMKYMLMEGFASLRDLFLGMGNDLVERDIIGKIDDIFYLTPIEIREFLAGTSFAKQAVEIIMERREQHAHWGSQTPSELIIDGESGAITLTDGELVGIGCSPGIVEGVARVLIDPSDVSCFKSGEILVTRYTDPGWSPIFLNCKAIVTEIGGFLSHGATVAREYSIPTVVNVSCATTRIHSGDLILVDGTNGLITICKRG